MMTKALHVLVVSDGRPGHEKQSFGIVASLKKRYTVNVLEFKVLPGFKSVLKAVAVFLGAGLADCSAFRPDLIVGTGSHTHLSMLALKKRLGGRAIVCMSPHVLIRGQFDMCCIPRHDRVQEENNIFLTDGPPGVNSDLRQHDLSSALVLIGGVDEKSHVWDSTIVAKQIAATIAQHHELTWTLTTSPRTPPDFLDIFAQNRPEIAINVSPFGSTEPGWVEKQLQIAKWVLVSEDSLSMIFEALSAGCHVVTIPVAFKRKNKFVSCLADLKKRKLVGSVIDPSVPDHEERFNEADRCVDFLIQQPWWPLR